MRRFTRLALASVALALVPARAALAVYGDRVLQADETCDARDVVFSAREHLRVGNDVNRTCTTDSCDVTDGCQHTPRPDGASCGDGTCHGGLCS